jgi:hypothetical protein
MLNSCVSRFLLTGNLSVSLIIQDIGLLIMNRLYLLSWSHIHSITTLITHLPINLMLISYYLCYSFLSICQILVGSSWVTQILVQHSIFSFYFTFVMSCILILLKLILLIVFMKRWRINSILASLWLWGNRSHSF